MGTRVSKDSGGAAPSTAPTPIRGAAGHPALKILAAVLFAALAGWWLAPIVARAQSSDYTLVSGTITDPRGYAYSNGTIRFVMSPSGVQNAYFTDTKSPVPQTIGPLQLSPTGNFQIGVPDNTKITPASTQWTATVCSSTQDTPRPPLGNGSQCFSVTVTISGSSQDVGATLSAAAPLTINPCLPTSPAPCGGTGTVTSGPTTPGSCSVNGALFVNTTNSTLYVCLNGSYVSQGSVTVVSTLPATCTQGTEYYNTTNQFLYVCGAGNTYTQVGNISASGALTTNQITKATGVNSIGDSTMSDDGSAPVRSPHGLNTATGPIDQEYTVATGGVTSEQALCSTGTLDSGGRPEVGPCSHTAAQPGAGFVGISGATVSAGGTVRVCWTTNCSALFDNQSTALDEAILSTTTDGELHDTGAQTATAGQPNFAVLAANTGTGTASPVGLTDMLAQNPKGGGPGGGSAYNFQAAMPIVLAQVGRTVTYSCPTCGGAISSSPPNITEATPIQVPGSTIVFSPDPAVAATPEVGSGVAPYIQSYTPERDIVVGHWYLIYYESIDVINTPACGIADLLGNAWTMYNPAGGTGVARFALTHATVGGADVISTNAGCANTASYAQIMAMVEIQNTAGLDGTLYAEYAPDSCGSLATPCTASLAIGQPGDLVFNFSALVGTTAGVNFGQLTPNPSGVSFDNSVGNPGYNFSASAAPTAGTYNFSLLNSSNAAGDTGGLIVAFAPATGLVGTASITQDNAAGHSVGQSGSPLIYSQTVTAGNTISVDLVSQNGLAGPTCTATDAAGTSFSTASGLGVGSLNTVISGTAGSTVSSDSITLSAGCANASVNYVGQIASVTQWSGHSLTVSPDGGSNGSNLCTYTYGATTLGEETIVPWMVNQSNSWTSSSWSPGLTVLSSSNSLIAYSLAVGQIGETSGVTYIGNNTNNNFQTCAGMVVTPTEIAKYPKESRTATTPDLGAPVTTQRLSFSATPVFDGNLAHAWAMTLSANVTSSTFAGFQDGYTYSFEICENATGGYAFAWPSNVSTPPTIATAANSCTVAGGMWDGANSKLVFAFAQTLPATTYAAIQSTTTCSLASDFALTGANTANSVLPCSVTMPSAGCPCRVSASYAAYMSYSAAATANLWVTDGTNQMAPSQGLSTASSPGGSVNSTDTSPVSYADGAVVPFVLQAAENTASTVTVVAAPTNSVLTLHSRVTITVYTGAN